MKRRRTASLVTNASLVINEFVDESKTTDVEDARCRGLLKSDVWAYPCEFQRRVVVLELLVFLEPVISSE